jgi:hypothetical protein
MTSATDSDPANPAPDGDAAERWTLTALIRRHTRLAAASLALVVVLVAVTLLTEVSSPRRVALSDAASCAQWAAATPSQQIAYSHLYIDEHGRFADTAAHAAGVRTEIERACTHASYLGEADDISIIAGLRHAF